MGETPAAGQSRRGARRAREEREREFLAPFFSGARFTAENKRGQQTHPNFFWAIRQYGSSSGYNRPSWSPCAPRPRTLCSRRARRRPWRRPRPSSSSGLSARRRPESPPGRRSPRRGAARIARQQRHARPWPFVRNVTVQAAGQLTRSQPRRSLPQFAVRSPPSELDGRKRRLGRTPMTVWSPLPPPPIYLQRPLVRVRDRNSILQAFFRFVSPFFLVWGRFSSFPFPIFGMRRSFR